MDTCARRSVGLEITSSRPATYAARSAYESIAGFAQSLVPTEPDIAAVDGGGRYVALTVYNVRWISIPLGAMKLGTIALTRKRVFGLFSRAIRALVV